MALPKIEFPTYSFTIPSTGKKVQYRPYTVKEEKNILIAKETADPETLLESVKDLMAACTFNKVDIGQLATFDFELLFLKIRSAAVGEKAAINVKCDSCGEFTEVGIKLDTAKVVGEVQKNKTIDISETIGVELSYPKFDATKDLVKYDNEVDQLLAVIRASIVSIYDGDSVYDPKDSTQQELLEFVESFPTAKIEEMAEFLNNVPYVTIERKFKCKHCGADNTTQLTGMEHFFF